MSPTLMQAVRRAIIAHDGQYRKYSGEPYIVHPLQALNVLRQYTNDTNTLCAGVLHDTLEDTDYTFDQMLKDFGPSVAGIVLQVTHAKEGSWRQRREAYLKKLEGDAQATMVACADKIANLMDTIAQGRKLTNDERWYYQSVAELSPEPIKFELEQLLKEGI